MRFRDFLETLYLCNFIFQRVNVSIEKKYDLLGTTKKDLTIIYNYVISQDFSILHKYLNCCVKSISTLDSKVINVVIYRKEDL